MGLWIRDGFEWYKNSGDGFGTGLWAGMGFGQPFSKLTPYGVGQSANTNTIFGGTLLTSGSSAFPNSGTVFGCCWLMSNGAPGGTTPLLALATYQDAGNNQCTVVITDGGHIQIRTGGLFGTLLGDGGQVVFNQQWEFYCWKIVIHNTAGEFHLRKNWDAFDTYSITGINTRGGTTNNQANGVVLSVNGGGAYLVDDLAHWDNSGSGDWSDFMLPVRAIALAPITDNSVQFTKTNGGSTQFGSTVNTSTATRALNNITATPFTPTCGGALGNITVELNAGITGHLNIAIYDSDGDNSNFPTSEKQPGNLIATCTQLTNPGSGVNVLTPTTTPILQNGRLYFICFQCDVTLVAKSDSASASGWVIPQTYGAFPSSLAGQGSSLSLSNLAIYATITPSNAGMVNDYQQDLATYVGDNTVSDQDLYDVQDLPASGISAVSGMDLTMLYAQDVVGTRTISALIKSGATTVTETAIQPLLANQYIRYKQDVDPNTSAAWTTSGINAMLIGQKIAS